MSSKSNDQGRAYEFACLIELEEAIKQHRPVSVLHNSSYSAAESAYNLLLTSDKETYHISARAMIPAIFDKKGKGGTTAVATQIAGSS